MWVLSLILLILLGLLGIASWLRATQPKFAAQLAPVENVGGWIGLVGLVWGIVMLLQWLQVLSYLSAAPVRALIGLASLLAVIALSLILALPTLKQLLGANDFTNKMAELADKLSGFKVALGFACLVLAALSLVSMI